MIEIDALVRWCACGHDNQKIALAAWNHGMTGLLYKHTPDPLLKQALFVNYAMATANTVAHMTVLRTIRKAGLEFLPFKGASLILRGLYPQDERPLLDLDLLVKPENLSDFVEYARSIGFRPQPTSNPTGISLHRGRLNMDLHTTPFMPELHIPVHQLWNKSQNGLLALEHEMLIVALHAAKSSTTTGLRLIWWVDMMRLRQRADLSRARKIASSWGVERLFSRTLLAQPIEFLNSPGSLGAVAKLRLSGFAGRNPGLTVMRLVGAGLVRMGFGTATKRTFKATERA